MLRFLTKVTKRIQLALLQFQDWADEHDKKFQEDMKDLPPATQRAIMAAYLGRPDDVMWPIFFQFEEENKPLPAGPIHSQLDDEGELFFLLKEIELNTGLVLQAENDVIKVSRKELKQVTDYFAMSTAITRSPKEMFVLLGVLLVESR